MPSALWVGASMPALRTGRWPTPGTRIGASLATSVSSAAPTSVASRSKSSRARPRRRGLVARCLRHRPRRAAARAPCAHSVARPSRQARPSAAGVASPIQMTWTRLGARRRTRTHGVPLGRNRPRPTASPPLRPPSRLPWLHTTPASLRLDTTRSPSQAMAAVASAPRVGATRRTWTASPVSNRGGRSRPTRPTSTTPLRPMGALARKWTAPSARA
mmetsp:Transcript_6082/g.18087  ORF Transcript_6082/g.18087 Transcript_6082/m.18087 type:complete len:216 (+) Transcript_6082:580-1227(+)